MKRVHQPFSFVGHPIIARVLALTFVTALAFALVSAPLVAGTVGAISGTVTDRESGKPVPSVRVTAIAAAATYHAITDGHGFFAMAGIAPDTYTLVFEINGYGIVQIAGVTAAADQNQTVSTGLTRSTLRTIGSTRARSASGAFQPNQTADTYTVNAAQIANIQGSPVNVSEKSLLAALPGVSLSAGNAPTIRGGRTNNVDYQFEGMSYTDPYLNKNINNFQFPGFAVSSVQVSPGVEDASFGNSGVGTVNVLARQGTYPGSIDLATGVGGPGFFHALNLGAGIATQNGRISDYTSYTAQNDAPRFGGKYAFESANSIGATGLIKTDIGREFTNNLVFHFGNANQFGLQYFVDNSFHVSTGGYGQDLGLTCYETCDASEISYFTGLIGINAQQYQNLMPLYPGQVKTNELLSATGRPLYQEIYNANGTKVQATWNPDSSTYFYANWYTSNGNTISDAAKPGLSIFRNEGGYTSSYTLGVNRQLGRQNALKLGLSTLSERPLNDGNFNNDEFYNLAFDPAKEFYDFISPTDPNCPVRNKVTGESYCGYLYKYFPGGPKMIPGASTARISNTGLSEFINDTWQASSRLKIDGGLRVEHQNNTLPSPGLSANCTFLYIPSAWQTPDANGLINGKPVGPGNCPAATFTSLDKQQTNPTVIEPRLAVSYALGDSNALRASFGRSSRFPHGQQSDYSPPTDYASNFAGIPTFFNPGLAIAGAGGLYKAGTYNAGTPYASTDPKNYYAAHNIATECGFNGYFVPCTSYQEQLYWSVENGDFAFPISPLKPVTYSNYDLSFSHSFGHGVSTKVTGWARRAYDLDITENVPSTTGFGEININSAGVINYIGTKIATNNGIEVADGLELYVTKEAPVGFSGLFSGTYNNVRQNVFPSEADEFHASINSNLDTHNELYRVGYISPVTLSLGGSYKTRDGWRLQARLFFDEGYPYGSGDFVPDRVNGVPVTVPNSNLIGGPAQFVDPSNPGTIVHPNIAATLGTKEGHTPDSLLTHPNLTAALTLDRTIGRYTIGLTVDNLFNEEFAGPTYPQGSFGNSGPGAYQNGSLYTGGAFSINNKYQPVATGISGPLTGADPTCVVSPGTCSTIGALANGTGTYINRPNAVGRSYYLYVSTHL